MIKVLETKTILIYNFKNKQKFAKKFKFLSTFFPINLVQVINTLDFDLKSKIRNVSRIIHSVTYDFDNSQIQ